MGHPVKQTVRSFLDEAGDLDLLVAGLTQEHWRTPTPAPGWTIAHQIAHLAWTDEVAHLALTDATAFAAVVREAATAPTAFVDRMAAQRAAQGCAELLAGWRRGRESLAAALLAADPAVAVPWFGPPMSPHSMATARLMETWVHGQDVADAQGVMRVATERLRDIAHLGVRTRNFAYRINGLEPPSTEFRIELAGPDAAMWTWGPAQAESSVRGRAEDFCLVVGQRREVDQTDLVATGEAAHWLTFAQAFAGPPKSAVRAGLNPGRAGRSAPPDG